MIKANLPGISKSNSLTAKIREAEQQILIRQRVIGVRTNTLIKKVNQEITAPSTLLVTFCIGFIIGELTKRQTSGTSAIADKQQTAGSSPLKTTLNLLISAHTLYTALPTAWKIKLFHQPQASDIQAPVQQCREAGNGEVPRR